MASEPDTTTVYVGKRLRGLRLKCGFSQEKVAEHLGISFQQVQKYEKGTNRIAPNRLQKAADLFDIPVSAFFPPSELTENAQQDAITADWSKEEFEAARHFAEIESDSVRRSVLALLKVLAKKDV